MAWPKTGATPRAGITAQGVTTMCWGTEELWGAFVVLRYNERPLVENIKLPQGSGLTSTRLLLFDGIVVDFTVRDDTTMTPPLVGTTLTIADAGGLLGNGRGATFTGRVVDGGYDVAPKQPGERTVSVEKLTLVD